MSGVLHDCIDEGCGLVSDGFPAFSLHEQHNAIFPLEFGSHFYRHYTLVNSFGTIVVLCSRNR